jgi:hypothetical protein
MPERATIRPKGFTRPAYWSDEPAPPPAPATRPSEDLCPTRYGDWVRKGIAVDF